MCRETVAAPPSLQDIVYPILSEKSLHFCEKCNDEIFTFFGTQSRSENSISGYGTAALSLAGNGACAGTAVQTLPKDSASAFLDDSTITVLRRESNSFSLILSEKTKISSAFLSICRKKLLRFSLFSARRRVLCRAPHSGQHFADWPAPVLHSHA